MDLKRLPAVYYHSETGAEPVRDWLKSLEKQNRFRTGTDIKTVEFGWPVGMPTCRPLGHGLYEVRTSLDNRIARVLFCIGDGRMILLHGSIKKTPRVDLEVARMRKRAWEAAA